MVYRLIYILHPSLPSLFSLCCELLINRVIISSLDCRLTIAASADLISAASAAVFVFIAITAAAAAPPEGLHHSTLTRVSWF